MKKSFLRNFTVFFKTENHQLKMLNKPSKPCFISSKPLNIYKIMRKYFLILLLLENIFNAQKNVWNSKKILKLKKICSSGCYRSNL